MKAVVGIPSFLLLGLLLHAASAQIEVAFQTTGDSEELTVAEDTGTGMFCAEIRSVPGGGATTTAITLVFTYNPTGGMPEAVLNTDFTVSGPSVTFPIGSSAGDLMCITVTAVTDAIPEGPEFSAITIDSDPDFVVSGGGTGFSGFITCIIADNDAPEYRFQSTTYSGTEGQSVEVCVIVDPFSGSTTQVATVDLVTMGVEATITTDFTGPTPSSTVTFPMGSTAADPRCVNYQLVSPDLLLEGDETFTVSLTTPNIGRVSATSSMTTITIMDSDSASVAVSQTETVAEDGTAAMVLVALTPVGGASLALAVTATLSTAIDTGGTAPATPTTDFNEISGTLVVFQPAMPLFDFVPVSAMIDSIAEGDETFLLQITGITGPAVIGTPSATTLTITDDDMFTVTIDAGNSDATRTEGDITLNEVCVVATGGGTTLQSAVTVTFALSGKGTIDDTNLSPAVEAVLPAGPTPMGCTSFRVFDDDLVEGPEEVTFTISSLSSNLEIMIGDPRTHVFTFMDNDGGTGTFTFVDASETVMEQAGETATFCVLLGGLLPAEMLGCPVTVTMELLNGNNANAGEDFITPGDLDLIFTTGSDNGDSRCLSISILEDFDFEGDHSFQVGIDTVTPSVITDAAGLAVVNILDDDDATVRLTNTQFSGTEGNTVDVCVEGVLGSPLGMFEANLVVQLTATDGSAVTGDYSPTTTSVTFSSATGTTLCAMFTLTDDFIVEGPETFTVAISDTGGATLGSPSSATVTINDDDVANLVLSSNSLSIGEGSSSSSLCLELSAGAGSPNMLADNLIVPISVTLDGKAENGDFTVPAQVTIPAGPIPPTPPVCIPIMTNEDTQIEGDHGFTLSITQPSLSAVTLGSPSSAAVTITDNEGPVTLQFETPAITVQEGVVSTLVCVVITIPAGSTLGCDITVPIVGNSGQRANSGTDFTLPSPSQVTFLVADSPVTGSSRCINVGIIDDDDYEGDHTFMVTFGTLSVSSTLASTTGPNSAVAVTIQDNNDATVTMMYMTRGMTEGDAATVDVCVNSGIAGNIELDLIVTLTTDDGKAMIGQDVVTPVNPLTVTFTASGVGIGPPTSSECVTYTIINDMFLEGDHQFVSRITGVPSDAVIGGQSTTTVTIADDDQGQVVFTTPSSSVEEGNAATAVCVSVSSGTASSLGCEMTITLTTATGKAETDDFTGGSYTVTLNDGTGLPASGCVSIPTTEDFVLEGDHEFSVSIDSISPVNAATFDGSIMHTVTINDDDGAATFALQAVTSPCSESDNPISVCAVISGLPAGGLGCDLSITLNVVDDTTAVGEDYTITSSTSLTFSSGSTSNSDSQCVQIDIIDDDIYEEDQQFSVNLQSTLPASVATVGSPSTVTKIIQDNNDAVAAFVMAEYRMGEEAGMVSVCVDSGVTQGFQADLTVGLSATDGKATVADDFALPTPFEVVFTSPSSQQMCIDIPIISDDQLEDDHDITVTIISAGSAPHASINVAMSTTTVIIEDDERGLVTLDPIVDVEEGGNVEVCVNLICSGSTLGCPLSVTLDVADSTKTVEGEDYQAGPYVVMFAIGDALPARSCATIMTIDDDNVEGPQQFTVSISTISLPNSVSELDPSMQSATLTDNDEVTVGFAPNTYNFGGGMGDVSLTLEVSGLGNGILECDVEVTVVYTDGPKAVSDMDYQPGTTVFTLPMTTTMDGNTITVPLTILSDEAVEGAHSFSAAVQDTPLVTPWTPATINITDNDFAAVQMAEPEYSVGEGDGSVMVCAQLTSLPPGGLECEIVVTMDPSDGTKAVAGNDFNGDPVEAVFPITAVMGDTACAEVPIVNDDALECSQEFTVAIVGATLGTDFSGPQAAATVTIVDNDGAGVTLSFTEATYDVNEGGVSVMVCIELGGLPAGGLECDIVIPLALQNGKAISEDDFGADPNLSITFSAAALQDTECATITIIEDTDIECEHRFSVVAGVIDCDVVPPLSVANPSAEVAIEDNDDFTVGMRDASLSVDEGVGALVQDICVTLDTQGGVVQCELTVEISPSAGTADLAVGKEDYVPGTYTIPIPPGSVSGDYCIDIKDFIVDDTILETTEIFSIHIIFVLPCGTVGLVVYAEISIIDNDYLIAGFMNSDYSVVEGTNQEICVDLEGYTERPIDDVLVNVKEIIGDNTDYSIVDTTLMFGVGASPTNCVVNERLCFTFEADQDDIKEEEEKFQLSLSSGDSGLRFCRERAHVAIPDDDTDMVTVSLSVGNGGNVSEDNGAMLVLVTLTGNLEVAVTVTVETVDGTANEGSDYRRVSHEIIFDENSDNPQRVYVPLLNDDCVEYDEYFTVGAITAMSCVNITGSPVTIHILDDDAAKISLTESFYKTSEDEGVVVICVILKNPVKRNVTFELEYIEITAGIGDLDFVPPVELTGTFIAGSDAGAYLCFRFIIVDDNCVEYKELFGVFLSSTDSDVDFQNHIYAANVSIWDNDYATFGVEFDSYVVEENAGSVRVCVEFLDGCLQRDVDIAVVTFDATAMNGSDYRGILSDVTFGPLDGVGDLECVDIEIINDDYKEDNESFVFALCSEDEAVHIEDFHADVYIIDDDSVSVSLSLGNPLGIVPEERGAMLVLVEVDGSLKTEITVTVETSDGTAEAPDDYISVMQEIIFNNYSVNPHRLYIPIVNDECPEDTEYFFVNITTSMDCVDLLNEYVEVTIIDDDIPELTLAPPFIEVRENELEIRGYVLLKSDLKRDVTFYLNLTQDTATGGVDFNDTYIHHTFPSGSSAGTYFHFSIEIFDDSIVENDETFSIVFASNQILRVHIPVILVRIIDDDTACVNFTDTSIEAPEDGEYAEVCVELDGETDVDLAVYLFTIPGTALAYRDFIPLQRRVVFSESGVICVNVSLVAGNVVENVEKFTVVLTTHDERLEVKEYYIPVYITDGDTVTVGFSQMVYTVEEEDQDGNGNVLELCINRIGSLDRSVTVYLTTDDGTAIAGKDYSDTLAVLTTVHFLFERKRSTSPDEQQQCVNISIIGDIIVEDTEVFSAVLTTDDPSVILSPEEAEIEIIDNDRAEVTLQQVAIPVDENQGEAEVCITLTAGELGNDIVILLNTDDITAEFGQDYEVQINTQIILPANSVAGFETCGVIPIINDSKVEDMERFSFTLSSNGPVDFSGSDSGVVFITDDDVVSIAWTQSLYRVREDALIVSACAEIVEGTLCRELQVQAQTADANIPPMATSGTDYVPNGDTFNFDEDTASACLLVTILDDQIPEENEYFSVLLTTVDTAAVIAEPRANVIIENNDVLVGFQQVEYAVCEGESPLTVCVDIDGQSPYTAVFTIATTNTGTADVGSDYLANSEQFSFNTGDNTPCIDIVIIDDPDRESCETFDLILTVSPISAANVILSPNSATVTINDDEGFEITYIDETPDITGAVVFGQFVIDGCIDTNQCQIGANGDPFACPGFYSQTLIGAGRRNVIITVNGFCGNSNSLTRSVRSDNPRCNLHQINGGEEEATVVGNTATVMFEGTGPSVTNVVMDYDIRIQQLQTGNSYATLENRVFQCSDTSNVPTGFSVQCTVNAATGHGEVIATGFTVPGSYRLLLHPLNPPTAPGEDDCRRRDPRGFDFSIV